MSSSRTADFTLRYQHVPGAQYHVRPLSLLQQDILYRCDGTVTIADLADATKYTHPEIRGLLHFLATHGLVKTLPPESWLLARVPQKSAGDFATPLPGRNGRLLPALKRKWRVVKVTW